MVFWEYWRLVRSSLWLRDFVRAPRGRCIFSRSRYFISFVSIFIQIILENSWLYLYVIRKYSECPLVILFTILLPLRHNSDENTLRAARPTDLPIRKPYEPQGTDRSTDPYWTTYAPQDTDRSTEPSGPDWSSAHKNRNTSLWRLSMRSPHKFCQRRAFDGHWTVRTEGWDLNLEILMLNRLIWNLKILMMINFCLVPSPRVLRISGNGRTSPSIYHKDFKPLRYPSPCEMLNIRSGFRPKHCRTLEVGFDRNTRTRSRPKHPRLKRWTREPELFDMTEYKPTNPKMYIGFQPKHSRLKRRTREPELFYMTEYKPTDPKMYTQESRKRSEDD